MGKFSELGIKVERKSFTGDKIKIDRILNREIIVHAFRLDDTKLDKQKGNGKCLTLQIQLGEIYHVVFTGSQFLQNMINQVPEDKFPFTTTIVKESESYQFT